ncbi:MAG TPA: DUF485 domain-containing protein [Terriglobales bacterium]|nr:DUF485 domain-containing protein [Terriglobales bacterium]
MAQQNARPVPINEAGAATAPATGEPDLWDRVAAMDEFKLLLLAKVEFVVPAVIVFVVYYFLLPISVGYFPQFMDKRVGPVNLAYLFALSQFFVAWLIAYLYVRQARKFDDFGKRITNNLEDSPKGGDRP